MSEREIVHRFPVQPGLWVAVEDSHCLLLQLTTPDGTTEIARSGVLGNGDDIQRAVELARVWVARAEDDADTARMRHLADSRSKRRNPRGGTAREIDISDGPGRADYDVVPGFSPVTYGDLRHAGERRAWTDSEIPEDALDRALGASPPANCPNCHGEREWSGRPGVAMCHFCGQES